MDSTKFSVGPVLGTPEAMGGVTAQILGRPTVEVFRDL